jgi:arabinose-5-phosphate isomerase
MKPAIQGKSVKTDDTEDSFALAREDEAIELASARRVLNLGSQALVDLAHHLGQDFLAAVQALEGTHGRIIVSGIGKSGHIARKIAATLASTGSPAQFVHPSEASHGDLGMITDIDSVLMLSNSGENQELKDLIAHTRRFSIPLIGISSRADSTLMKHATVRLLLPSAQEACPMGFAPTTSTTLMLALGDALAVSIMEKRGFSADDYRVLHPGGQLGKSLICIQDIMHGPDELPLANPQTPISDVIDVMSAKGFGCAGIVDQSGGIVGIITDGDLRRNMGPDLLQRTAQDVMTPNPKIIRASALAAEAVAYMNNSVPPFLCVFVKHEQDPKNQPVGILHMHDCLKAGIT